MDRRREIYIRLEQLPEVVELMKSVKNREEYLKKLFYEYDKLNLAENKYFENWSNYLEDVHTKLDHLTL